MLLHWPGLALLCYLRSGKAASLVTLLTDLPVAASVSDAGSGAVRLLCAHAFPTTMLGQCFKAGWARLHHCSEAFARLLGGALVRPCIPAGQRQLFIVTWRSWPKVCLL